MAWNWLRKSPRCTAPITRSRRKQVVLNLERLEDRLTPAYVYWDGGGSDSVWEDPLNWQGDLLPGAGDDAVIGPGYSVVNNLPSTSIASLASSSPITFNGALTIGGPYLSYIDAAVSFYGDLTLGGSLNLGSLMGGGGSFNADVHIAAGAELTLAGLFAFADGVDVDGDGWLKVLDATANIGGAVSFDNLHVLSMMNGNALTGAGTATIKKTMNYYSGKLEGSGTLKIDTIAALNILDMSSKTIIGWTIDNEGTTNWSGGNIATTNVVFTNKAGAVYNVNQSAGNWTATEGSFQNQGTFRSNEAEHVMAIEFVSTNQAEVLSGNLTFTRGREFGGTVTIQANSSVTLSAGSFTFNAALNINGDGVMIQNGANTTVAGTVNAKNYELRLGTLEGPGTFNIGGTFTWSGGTMTGAGTTRVLTSGNATISGVGVKNLIERILINDTVMHYTAGTLQLSQGANLTNNGIFDIRDNLNIVNGGAPASVIWNYDEFRKSQVSGESRIDVPFNNASGAIKVQAGTLIFDVELNFLLTTELPTLDVAANTECKVQYMNLNAGTITGAGTLSTLPGGTINWYNGTASGSGLLHNVATGLVKVDGPMTLSGFTWTNEGTVNWQSGNIQLGTGSIVNNQPGADFQAFSDNDMTGAGIFYNYGSFSKLQGVAAGAGLDIATKIIVRFDNKRLAGQAPASVNSVQGTISLRQAGTHSAEFNAGGNAAIEFNGNNSAQTVQQATEFLGNGAFFLYNLATITVPASATVPNAAAFVLGPRVANPLPLGGTITGAGTFANNGTVTWVIGGLLDLHEFQNNNLVEFTGTTLKTIRNSLLMNNATITWSDGNIEMSFGAVIDNRRLFDVRTDSTILNVDGYLTPGLLNSDTVQKTAGGGVTTIQVGFSQSLGSCELNGRNMTFTRDFLQTGGQAKLNNGVDGGGTLAINGKYNLTNQSSSLSIDEGTLTVNGGLFVQGGTVSNASGTINGNVSNAGLVLIGGTSRISALFVNGDFTQTADGTLRFEIRAPGGGNPVSYDNLHVYGTLTAAGTLDVVALQPFFPAVGNQFQLIGFLARAGDWGILNLPDLPVGRSWKQQKWFENEFTLEVQ